MIFSHLVGNFTFPLLFDSRLCLPHIVGACAGPHGERLIWSCFSAHLLLEQFLLGVKCGESCFRNAMWAYLRL